MQFVRLTGLVLIITALVLALAVAVTRAPSEQQSGSDAAQNGLRSENLPTTVVLPPEPSSQSGSGLPAAAKPGTGPAPNARYGETVGEPSMPLVVPLAVAALLGLLMWFGPTVGPRPKKKIVRRRRRKRRH